MHASVPSTEARNMYLLVRCSRVVVLLKSTLQLNLRVFLDFVSYFEGAELDEATVEGLVREFAASWKSGIEAINQDVLSFFSNFRNGMEILKQVIVLAHPFHEPRKKHPWETLVEIVC